VHQHPSLRSGRNSKKENEKGINLRRTVCVERNLTTHQQKSNLSLLLTGRLGRGSRIDIFLSPVHHASPLIKNVTQLDGVEVFSLDFNLGPTKSDLAVAADPFMQRVPAWLQKIFANFEIR